MEFIKIETITVELTSGDDVILPFTDISIDLTGYTHSGDVRDISGSVIGSLTITATADSITVKLPNTISTLMTTFGDSYYSNLKWVDTSGNVTTWIRIVWRVI